MHEKNWMIDCRGIKEAGSVDLSLISSNLISFHIISPDLTLFDLIECAVTGRSHGAVRRPSSPPLRPISALSSDEMRSDEIKRDA